MYVKICGVRTEADIRAAADAGADAVGIVLGPSVRRVDAGCGRRLVASTPPGVLAVGVFGGVPVEEVAELAVACGVGAVQLHGPYPRAAFTDLLRLQVPLWRATSLAERPDLRVGAYGEEVLLLDSADAGAGRRWDLGALDAGRPDGRWLLAGGLTPDGVVEAITTARPWGVDVSSGVESVRGVKDHGRIRHFVERARSVSNS